MRRLLVAAPVIAAALVAASPALAAWTANGVATAAAKAGTASATSGGTVSCASGSGSASLSWSASTTTGAKYTILRKKNSGAFAVVSSGLTVTSTTNSMPNGDVVGDQFFYAVRVTVGTNWKSSDVQLAGNATVASVNGGGNSPTC